MNPTNKQTENETRENYKYFLEIPTRSADLDQNGHVNQAVYHSFTETLLTAYLLRECGFESNAGDVSMFCVENGCRYRRELNFPQIIEAGLRITHIGNSSARFESALFTAGQEAPAATGFFVQVFVDSQTRRPIPIPPDIRATIEKIRQSPHE